MIRPIINIIQKGWSLKLEEVGLDTTIEFIHCIPHSRSLSYGPSNKYLNLLFFHCFSYDNNGV